MGRFNHNSENFLDGCGIPSDRAYDLNKAAVIALKNEKHSKMSESIEVLSKLNLSTTEAIVIGIMFKGAQEKMEQMKVMTHMMTKMSGMDDETKKFIEEKSKEAADICEACRECDSPPNPDCEKLNDIDREVREHAEKTRQARREEGSDDTEDIFEKLSKGKVHPENEGVSLSADENKRVEDMLKDIEPGDKKDEGTKEDDKKE